MKLMVIYGPPGVGKLTVANELSKITGYKVLHNHLVIDLVESVFDRSDERFWRLIDEYRINLVGLAAQSGLKGMILTSVNIKGKDDEFIKNLIQIMEKNSGEIHFVRLRCDMSEMKRRLADESRRAYGKLRDVRILDEFISKNEVLGSIGFVESLSIDNTNISGKDAAEKIKEYYKL